MIVPGHGLLCDALILHRGLQHHAAIELINHGAMNFLPWGLTRREPIAAVAGKFGPARVVFGGRNQEIGSSLVEIDAYPVARPEYGESASDGRLRRRVEDRRRA